MYNVFVLNCLCLFICYLLNRTESIAEEVQSYERTGIFIRAPTSPGQTIFIRGGRLHFQKYSCLFRRPKTHVQAIYSVAETNNCIKLELKFIFYQ